MEQLLLMYVEPDLGYNSGRNVKMCYNHE